MKPPGFLLGAGLMIAVIMGVSHGSVAANYYLATDVPAKLGAGEFTADEILLSANGAYSVQLSFGDEAIQVGALERRADGLWLLTPAKPEQGVGPRDVVLFDGINPAPYFDGAATGVPEYARIDAVMLDAGGDLVLSLDVPVNLGGTEFGPSDLVRYSSGTFSLYWSAAAAGVPPDSNVVGAGRTAAGEIVLTFDVPTRLDATDFLPGQLVRWNGGTGFSAYVTDPTWPSYAQLRDFSFLTPAGAVPDGGDVPGIPLRVMKSGASLVLTWGSSCAPSDNDYEVYEGSLAQPFTYEHTEKLCTTSGAISATFAAPAGSAYYLVVPRNAASEGSYGRASSGVEIPVGVAACLPQQIAAACP